jgi:hypothetical protein
MALRFRFALPGLMPRSSRIGLTITKGFNEPLTLSVTVDAHYATCVSRIMRDNVVEASWPNAFRGRRFRKSVLAVGCDNCDLYKSRLSIVSRIIPLSK